MSARGIHKTSADGLAFIRGWESFSATVYTCAAGKLTVGFGHVVTTADRSKGRFDKPITREVAEAILRDDVAPIELWLNAIYPPGRLVQCHFDALVSFCFNLGIAAFEGSTLRALFDAGRTRDAADQFGRWVYATDPATKQKRVLNGLVKRRAAEQRVFLGDFAAYQVRP